MTFETETLKDIYAQASVVYEVCTSSERTGTVEQNVVLNALELVQKAQRICEKADIVSANETIDEIAEEDLKLLLLPAMEAKLLSLNVRSGEGRIDAVRSAIKSYKQFLYGLDMLDALPEIGRRYLRQLESGAMMAPNREEKIERFKRAQEINRIIEGLRGQADMSREYTMHVLVKFSQTSLEELDALTMELALLESRKSQLISSQTDRGKEKERMDDTWRVDLPKPLVDKGGKVKRNFVIHSDRAQVRDRVFRPGHNLPTMSIDEYLANEKARGNFLQGGTNEDVLRANEIKAQNEDKFETDVEWRKNVAWDDWKDDNQKGEGNRGYNRG